MKATLGQSKSADGLQAVVWWRQGRKQEVIDYCIQDVKVTRDVYDYALKNNKLKVDNKGIIEEIILDTSLWEKVEEKEAQPLTLF